MKLLYFTIFGFLNLLGQYGLAQVNKSRSQNGNTLKLKQVIDERIVTFIGTERLSIIQNADSILVYELNPEDNMKRQDSELLDGFYIIKKPRKLNKTEMKGIKHQIIQPKSYDFSGVYQLCAFSPVVAFEFYFQSKTVRVLLCFFCNDLIFFDAKGRTAGKSFEKAHYEWELLVRKILNPKNNRKNDL